MNEHRIIDLMRAFEQDPPELDFVLPAFLAGTVGALVSPGGAGKSFFALEAAMGIACTVAGGDLLSLEPRHHGPVYYFAAEDPETALIRRVHAIGGYLHPDARTSIAENLAIEPIIGSMLNIADDRQRREIIERCVGVRLIVLDTLSRIHQLDENSNRDMARLISILENIAVETGASVLFLHHSSKAAALAE
jgi:regulatory protein RepA